MDMETRFIETAEGRLAYDDVGNGELVICIPSMGDVRGEYRFLVPHLVAAGYRVVTLDVRGHGETSARWPDYSVAGVGADILTLMRDLKAGPATLIGTSMASGASVWAAAEAPELVKSLVLIGPFVRGEGSLFTRLLFGGLFMRPWGPAMWLRYYATLYPTRKPDDFAAYSAALRANLNEAGRMESLLQMILASKRASEERVSSVKAPTLVLMGSRDPDFKAPEVEAQWVAQHLNGRYELLPGAGHYPHAEMPELTAQLIVPFLQSLQLQTEKSYAA
jgi:pimeloyl-ACP methyl ester carboxylesterase